MKIRKEFAVTLFIAIVFVLASCSTDSIDRNKETLVNNELPEGWFKAGGPLWYNMGIEINAGQDGNNAGTGWE